MNKGIGLIEKLIGKLKKDPDYKININYSNRELFYIVLYRSVQLLRGILKRLRFKSVKGILFCGKGVVIRHGYLISCAGNTIIDDGVNIDALSEKGIKMGRNVTVAKSSIITCTGVLARKGVGIEIGNNSAIGANSFLGGQGGIVIGNDVIMGPGVKIFSENHNYAAENILIRKQGENRKGVVLESNCWVGAGTTILDGVTVGPGCVIAAGSVLTKSFPCNSVIAGVPAKIIKSRI